MKITITSALANMRFRQSLAICPPESDTAPGDWGSAQAEKAQRGDLLFVFKPFGHPEELDDGIELDGVAFVFREDAGYAMSYYMDAKTFEMGFLEGVLSSKATEATDAGLYFAYCAAHLTTPADEELMKRLSNMHKWPGSGNRDNVKDGLPDPLYFYLTTLSIPVDPTLSRTPIPLDELATSLISPNTLSPVSKSPKLADMMSLYIKTPGAKGAEPAAAAPAPAPEAFSLRDLFSDGPAPAPTPAPEPAKAAPQPSSLRDLFSAPAAPKPAAPAPAAAPQSLSLRNLFSDEPDPAPAPTPAPAPAPAPAIEKPGGLRDLFAPVSKPAPPVQNHPPVQKTLSLESLFADEPAPVIRSPEAKPARGGGLFGGGGLFSSAPEDEAASINKLFSDPEPTPVATPAVAAPVEAPAPAAEPAAPTPVAEAPAEPDRLAKVDAILAQLDAPAAPTAPSSGASTLDQILGGGSSKSGGSSLDSILAGLSAGTGATENKTAAPAPEPVTPDPVPDVQPVAEAPASQTTSAAAEPAVAAAEPVVASAVPEAVSADNNGHGSNGAAEAAEDERVSSEAEAEAQQGKQEGRKKFRDHSLFTEGDTDGMDDLIPMRSSKAIPIPPAPTTPAPSGVSGFLSDLEKELSTSNPPAAKPVTTAKLDASTLSDFLADLKQEVTMPGLTGVPEPQPVAAEPVAAQPSPAAVKANLDASTLNDFISELKQEVSLAHIGGEAAPAPSQPLAENPPAGASEAAKQNALAARQSFNDLDFESLISAAQKPASKEEEEAAAAAPVVEAKPEPSRAQRGSLTLAHLFDDDDDAPPELLSTPEPAETTTMAAGSAAAEVAPAASEVVAEATPEITDSTPEPVADAAPVAAETASEVATDSAAEITDSAPEEIAATSEVEAEAAPEVAESSTEAVSDEAAQAISEPETVTDGALDMVADGVTDVVGEAAAEPANADSTAVEDATSDQLADATAEVVADANTEAVGDAAPEAVAEDSPEAVADAVLEASSISQSETEAEPVAESVQEISATSEVQEVADSIDDVDALADAGSESEMQASGAESAAVEVDDQQSEAEPAAVDAESPEAPSTNESTEQDAQANQDSLSAGIATEESVESAEATESNDISTESPVNEPAENEVSDSAEQAEAEQVAEAAAEQVAEGPAEQVAEGAAEQDIAASTDEVNESPVIEPVATDVEDATRSTADSSAETEPAAEPIEATAEVESAITEPAQPEQTAVELETTEEPQSPAAIVEEAAPAPKFRPSSRYRSVYDDDEPDEFADRTALSRSANTQPSTVKDELDLPAAFAGDGSMDFGGEELLNSDAQLVSSMDLLPSESLLADEPTAVDGGSDISEAEPSHAESESVQPVAEEEATSTAEDGAQEEPQSEPQELEVAPAEEPAAEVEPQLSQEQAQSEESTAVDAGPESEAEPLVAEQSEESTVETETESQSVEDSDRHTELEPVGSIDVSTETDSEKGDSAEQLQPTITLAPEPVQTMPVPEPSVGSNMDIAASTAHAGGADDHAFEELSFKRLKSMSLNELLTKLEEQSRTARQRLNEILQSQQMAFEKDIALLSADGDEASQQPDLAEELRQRREDLLLRLRETADSGVAALQAKTSEGKQNIEALLAAGIAQIEEIEPSQQEALLLQSLDDCVSGLDSLFQERLNALVSEQSEVLQAAGESQLKRFATWAETKIPRMEESLQEQAKDISVHSREWLQHHTETTMAKLHLLHDSELNRLLINKEQLEEELHAAINTAEIKILESSEQIVSAHLLPLVAKAKNLLNHRARDLRLESVKKLTAQLDEAVSRFEPTLALGREAISIIENNGLELREQVNQQEKQVLERQSTTVSQWFEGRLEQLKSELSDNITGRGGEGGDDRQIRLERLAEEVKQGARTESENSRTAFKAVIEKGYTEREERANEASNKYKSEIASTVKTWREQTEECIKNTNNRLEDIRKKIQNLHSQLIK